MLAVVSVGARLSRRVGGAPDPAAAARLTISQVSAALKARNHG
ncbi:hypothetical protein ABZW11_18170 [Nonomuraea sp. NPDC004580]